MGTYSVLELQEQPVLIIGETGVGVSAAVQVVERDTRAVLGNLPDEAE